MFLWISFFAINAQGVIHFNNAPDHFTQKEIGQYLQRAENLLQTNPKISIARESKNTLLYYNEEVIFIANGYSYVFKWIDSTFVNQYKSVFHGFNFGAVRTIFDEKIYSYGGYGFWSYFNRICYFDTTVNEWEYIEFDFEKIDHLYSQHHMGFSNGKSIWVLFLDDQKPDGQYLKKKPEMYEIVLQDGKVIKHRFKKNPHLIGAKAQFQTANYYLAATDAGLQVIDKNTLKYKYLPVEGNADILAILNKVIDNDNLKGIAAKGDSLFLYENGPIFTAADIDQWYQNSKTSPLSLVSRFRWNYLPFILVIIVISGMAWKQFISGRNASDGFPYEKLLSYDGQVIDKQKLDECFNLNYLSEQSRANRRADILKSINQFYKNVVTIKRVKNTDDLRVYDYRITIPKNDHKKGQEKE